MLQQTKKYGDGGGVPGLCSAVQHLYKIDLVTEEWLGSFRNLRQHRGQHSPSGTVALEQGMMGQDTFLQMVTEFCRARERDMGY